MLLYILFLVVCVSVNGNFVPTHNIVLKEGVYYLYWQYTNESITFEVQVKTTGWVGFGLSPNGKMVNSDVVIGWVSNGNNYFKDRFATAQSLPPEDSSQDWSLLNAVENGTWTSLRFTRNLTTCDDRDLPITESTLRVIWAYHTSDPVSGAILKHTERGAKSVQLLSYGVGVNIPATPQDAFFYDLLQPNVSVPSKDTTYLCTGFKINKSAQKQHAIKFEPIVQAGHEMLVHHILVYGCHHSVNDSLHLHTAECYTANMPDDFNKCNAVMFSWAIGGGEFYYPEHVGFPFANMDGPDFLVIETHFDNPNQRSGQVDASGLRITLTRTLRQYEAGTLDVGYGVGEGQIIPPGLSSFTTVGSCDPACLSEALANQQNGIKIVATFLHAHLLGRKIKLRHIRNGVELPYISYDENYDFNFQETRKLKQEVTVLPGDELRPECTMDSTGRQSISTGGLSSNQEMCLVFITYYPKINLTECLSTSYIGNLVKILGNDAVVSSYEASVKVTLTAPSKYAGQSVQQVFDSNVNWQNQSIVKDLEDKSTTTDRYSFCQMGAKTSYSSHRKLNYKLQEVTSPYVPPVDNMCGTTTVATTTPSTAPKSLASSLTVFFITVILSIV